MPIYEYECESCGHKLEAFQKVSEAPLTTCPNCHKTSLHKLISAAGFQLKGTGWYATDFRNKGKPEAKSEQTDKKEATGTETAKTKDDKGKDDKGSSSDSKTGAT